MNKILTKKGMVITLSVFIFLVVISLIAIPFTNINYNMSKYLPKDSLTNRSLKVMKDEFGVTSQMQVMIKEDNLIKGAELKEAIKGVEGVKEVVWLGTIVDIYTPLSNYNQQMIESMYKDGRLLYQIEFENDEFHNDTNRAIVNIKEILDTYDGAYRGEPVNAKFTRDLVFKEALTIMLIVVPIALVILILFSSSWIEPVVVLLNLLIAVAINMGTNVLMPSVSFFTFAISSALQLAISLDYSLFFIHRYLEKREDGNLSKKEAAISAVKDALGSVTASALTTVFGFLALLWMRYTLGVDVGLNLGKAVVISYITALILMPVFLVLFDNLIIKSRHKTIIPDSSKSSKFVYKTRYILTIGLVILGISAFYFQRQTKFFYGTDGIPDKNKITTRHDNEITDVFGPFQPVVLLYDNDDKTSAITFSKTISESEHVMSIQSLVTTIDPTLPESIIPNDVLKQFKGKHYSRMIINLNIRGESEEMYDTSKLLKEEAEKAFGDDVYILGLTTSLEEIRDVTKQDGFLVTLISITSIFIVIMVIFKSISIPAVLVLLIEVAIFSNMSLPYFQGRTISYIGYLIVSALQLGATIDYAVLTASRYQEFRKESGPRRAMFKAVQKSSHTIIVSSLVLMVAGFSEAMISQVSAVKEMGSLIGFGALFSALLVIFVLPALLVVFDKPIQLLTLKKKEEK